MDITSELPANNITKKKKKPAKETNAAQQQQQEEDSLLAAASGALNETSNNNIVGSSSSSSAAAAPPLPPTNNSNKTNLEITVSDPQKQGEGISSFVSYKIRTRVLNNSPGATIQFDYDDFTVVRRYSDFAWLHGQFENNYPGIIIPPLPEKLVVGKFSAEFIESRRRSLEKFLQRIAQHALLVTFVSFKCFLELSEENFTKHRNGNLPTSLMGSAASPFPGVLSSVTSTIMGAGAGANPTQTGSGGGFWEWAAEATQQISNKLNGTAKTGASLRERTPDDDRFDEASRYINGFEPHIQAVYANALEMSTRNRELSNSLFEFGLSFTLLGQAEQGVLGSAFSQLGVCGDRLSVLAAEEADKEAIIFVDQLRDYVRLVAAARKALEVRTQKRIVYETALADVTAKKTARARLNTNAANFHAQIELADQEIVRSEAKAEGAKEDFDVVTKRVLVEIEHFKKEKLQDFKKITIDYVQLQIEHNQKVEASWQSVLPALNVINVNETAGNTTTTTNNTSMNDI